MSNNLFRPDQPEEEQSTVRVSRDTYEALQAENERLRRELEQYKYLLFAAGAVEEAYEALRRELKKLKKNRPDT